MGRPVTRIRLRHVHRFKDRHGRIRHYLRLPNRPAVALPGAPGSAEFMAAYNAAVAEAASAAPRPAGAARVVPGSIDDLVVRWYESPGFTGLRPQTQATYRRTLERLRAAHGHRLVAEMQPAHVRTIRNRMAKTPAAANNLLGLLRVLMQFAIEEGMREDDPTRDVRRLRYEKTGWHTWTEEEIATFRAHWAVGTKPRLALELLLHTGQRRGDVVRMGRQHLRNGGTAIAVKQGKTGTMLELPLHPELRAVIEALPADQLTFLLTEAGVPFTAGGFYNRFSEWAEAAGLPKGCSPHGLRKAAARRLAEAGCTPHEIAAITGHRTLSEVQRYTQAADQKRLAQGAIVRLGQKPAS